MSYYSALDMQNETIAADINKLDEIGNLEVLLSYGLVFGQGDLPTFTATTERTGSLVTV